MPQTIARLSAALHQQPFVRMRSNGRASKPAGSNQPDQYAISIGGIMRRSRSRVTPPRIISRVREWPSVPDTSRSNPLSAAKPGSGHCVGVGWRRFGNQNRNAGPWEPSAAGHHAARTRMQPANDHVATDGFMVSSTGDQQILHQGSRDGWTGMIGIGLSQSWPGWVRTALLD
jgi:hypothetical protein